MTAYIRLVYIVGLNLLGDIIINNSSYQIERTEALHIQTHQTRPVESAPTQPDQTSPDRTTPTSPDQIETVVLD